MTVWQRLYLFTVILVASCSFYLGHVLSDYNNVVRSNSIEAKLLRKEIMAFIVQMEEINDECEEELEDKEQKWRLRKL